MGDSPGLSSPLALGNLLCTFCLSCQVSTFSLLSRRTCDLGSVPWPLPVPRAAGPRLSGLGPLA